MMSRRAARVAQVLLGLLAALAAACIVPPRADAQGSTKAFRLAYLSSLSESDQKYSLAALRQGLRALGYREGQNIVITARYAGGKFERLSALAAELVALKPDVIVTAGPQPARAVKQATDTIPIVLAVISDPVGEGLVASLARPGGNITGMSFENPELTAKRLELLTQAVPGVKRIAVLSDATFGPTGGLRELQAAAPALGLELNVIEVRGPDAFTAAFRSARSGRADALVVLASPLLNAHRRELVEHAARNRLPATYEVRAFVEAGGLMSYGPSFADMYRRSAAYVDKILKGARPADLPVEQASRFELVVNLKTAEALGLTLPPSVLQRADEVIH